MREPRRQPRGEDGEGSQLWESLRKLGRGRRISVEVSEADRCIFLYMVHKSLMFAKARVVRAVARANTCKPIILGEPPPATPLLLVYLRSGVFTLSG